MFIDLVLALIDEVAGLVAEHLADLSLEVFEIGAHGLVCVPALGLAALPILPREYLEFVVCLGLILVYKLLNSLDFHNYAISEQVQLACELSVGVL
jgi:hypothetical protein